MSFSMWLYILFVLIPSVLCETKACPGGTFSCPDTATCCQLADKSYGCCPLKNAVCCDDHIHCCPSDSKCAAGMCIERHGTNITAKRLDENVIHCDSKFTCPDDSTCCKGSLPGTYECCPLPNGVCCSDFLHCCPENTVCNLEKQTCVGKGFISEMYDSKKNGIFKFGFSKYSTLLEPIKLKNVFCPDGSYQCPDGYTCCQMPSGAWGCCPFPQATCCPDKLHCCPHNMKCDSTSMSCTQGLVSIPSLQKEITKPLVCPDNSTCADTMTCCKISTEHFGCCPYEDAVCCKDLTHCCPSNNVCDIVQKKCVPTKSRLSNVSKYKTD